jgi:hypothetical protein
LRRESTTEADERRKPLKIENSRTSVGGGANVGGEGTERKLGAKHCKMQNRGPGDGGGAGARGEWRPR